MNPEIGPYLAVQAARGSAETDQSSCNQSVAVFMANISEYAPQFAQLRHAETTVVAVDSSDEMDIAAYDDCMMDVDVVADNDDDDNTVEEETDAGQQPKKNREPIFNTAMFSALRDKTQATVRGAQRMTKVFERKAGAVFAQNDPLPTPDMEKAMRDLQAQMTKGKPQTTVDDNSGKPASKRRKVVTSGGVKTADDTKGRNYNKLKAGTPYGMGAVIALPERVTAEERMLDTAIAPTLPSIREVIRDDVLTGKGPALINAVQRSNLMRQAALHLNPQLEASIEAEVQKRVVATTAPSTTSVPTKKHPRGARMKQGNDGHPDLPLRIGADRILYGDLSNPTKYSPTYDETVGQVLRQNVYDRTQKQYNEADSKLHYEPFAASSGPPAIASLLQPVSPALASAREFSSAIAPSLTPFEAFEKAHGDDFTIAKLGALLRPLMSSEFKDFDARDRAMAMAIESNVDVDMSSANHSADYTREIDAMDVVADEDDDDDDDDKAENGKGSHAGRRDNFQRRLAITDKRNAEFERIRAETGAALNDVKELLANESFEAHTTKFRATQTATFREGLQRERMDLLFAWEPGVLERARAESTTSTEIGWQGGYDLSTMEYRTQDLNLATTAGVTSEHFTASLDREEAEMWAQLRKLENSAIRKAILENERLRAEHGRPCFTNRLLQLRSQVTSSATLEVVSRSHITEYLMAYTEREIEHSRVFRCENSLANSATPCSMLQLSIDTHAQLYSDLPAEMDRRTAAMQNTIRNGDGPISYRLWNPFQKATKQLIKVAAAAADPAVSATTEKRSLLFEDRSLLTTPNVKQMQLERTRLLSQFGCVFPNHSGARSKANLQQPYWPIAFMTPRERKAHERWVHKGCEGPDPNKHVPKLCFLCYVHEINQLHHLALHDLLPDGKHPRHPETGDFLHLNRFEVRTGRHQYADDVMIPVAMGAENSGQSRPGRGRSLIIGKFPRYSEANYHYEHMKDQDTVTGHDVMRPCVQESAAMDFRLPSA